MEDYWNKDSEARKSKKIIFEAKHESLEEKILSDFKFHHPELMRLNPELDLILITEKEDKETGQWIALDSPIIDHIKVAHYLIFDNRLIPSEFLGIEVQNIRYEDEFSKFFLDGLLEDDFIPIYLVESPDKYEKFVKLNLHIVRKKLLNQDLTHEEALDALTGGFDSHKKWVRKMEEIFIKNQNEK